MRLVTVALLVFAACASSEETMVQINEDNMDEVLASTEIVMVNFYADWCRFCQMLRPVYAEAAEDMKDVANVRFGRVDCEDAKTQSLKKKYGIAKYPTLKIFRHGVPLKSEYRGQRSAEAITNFLNELLAAPVSKVENDQEAQDHISRKRKGVIGKFASEEHEHYKAFEAIASQLRDDCHFVAMFGDQYQTSDIRFKSKSEEFVFEGDATNQPGLLEWARDSCNPLVREITFENGEELTEEGLPFLILFHAPDDVASAEEFTQVVNDRFQQERGQINFIIADGIKFAHPLKHLGKGPKDLPVLAFDTFKHMYLFRKFSNIRKPGRLEKFVSDLHSGKLHHDFHHGGVQEDPDSPDEEDDKEKTLAEKLEDKHEEAAEAAEMTEKLKQAVKQAEQLDKKKEAQIEKLKKRNPNAQIPDDHHDDDPSKPVPVKSVLKHLKPSENRYSFAHEEL